MKLIEDRILKNGVIIGNDTIKVDSFLNHQIDTKTLREFAKEVKKEFQGKEINKVLTIETSGIAVAYALAIEFGDVPLVFAKKSKSKITDDNAYKTSIKSFTRNIVSDVIVSKEYLCNTDKILIADDFLAEGNAALGLIDLCKQAHAEVVGVSCVIEKYFQGGHQKIEELGIKVYAGASIKEFKDNKPIF